MKQSDGIISAGVFPDVDADEDGDTDDIGTQEPAGTNVTDDATGAVSSPAVESRQATVGVAHHQQRLDRVLAELVPQLSRSYLQQLLALGCVQCNTRVQTKPATRVRAGDHLVVTLRPTPQSQSFHPEPMGLEVVFEDAHLLVIDKPAGLVVHPAPGHWSSTLLNGLLAHHPGAAQLPRAGIVHRLDKDTSGLMVVAKTRGVMDQLVRMIAARTVSRQYQALAHGRWTGTATRRVDAAIGRDPRNRLRMAVLDPALHPAKTAVTDIERLADVAQGCWVRCALHTGRTHQIRVHMASIGHPLLADTLYGGRPTAGLQRQALHAWRLAFEHPVERAPLVFESGLPADLLEALSAWGLDYNRPPAR